MKCMHSSLAVEICAVCLDDLRIALAAAESKLNIVLDLCRKAQSQTDDRDEWAKGGHALAFDEAIERDAKSGRLDWLAEEARIALEHGEVEDL